MNRFYEKFSAGTKSYKPGMIIINEDKIKETAKEWARLEPTVPNWREPYMDFYPQGDDDDFIQFLGVATAINAYYRHKLTKQKYANVWKNKERRGAEGMCAAIMNGLEEKKPLLNAEYLAEIKPDDMKVIFAGDPPMPLLDERLNIWHELGRVLLEKYDGHFRNLFEAANYRCFDNGNGICERLINDFPYSFYDVRQLNGQILPFHKKALLLPLIYYGRAEDSDILEQLKDPESISDVCDYQVLRTQRHLKHTTYREKLSEWIAEQRPIPKGWTWETDLRISQIKVNDMLHKAINKYKKRWHKKKIMRLHLDFPLWKASRSVKEYKHHITPTRDY